MKVKILVGYPVESTLDPDLYFENSEQVIDHVYNRVIEGPGIEATKSATYVVALQALHAQGKLDVRFIDRHGDYYDLDVRGDFIQPWKDNFLELDFGLRFFEREKGRTCDTNSDQ